MKSWKESHFHLKLKFKIFYFIFYIINENKKFRIQSCKQKNCPQWNIFDLERKGGSLFWRCGLKYKKKVILKFEQNNENFFMIKQRSWMSQFKFWTFYNQFSASSCKKVYHLYCKGSQFNLNIRILSISEIWSFMLDKMNNRVKFRMKEIIFDDLMMILV